MCVFSVICPNGWIESIVSGTCIKTLHARKSWIDARSTCQVLGGDLVKIDSYAMHEFVHGRSDGAFYTER